MDLERLNGPQRSELEMCVRKCVELILKQEGGHVSLLRTFGWTDEEIQLALVAGGVA